MRRFFIIIIFSVFIMTDGTIPAVSSENNRPAGGTEQIFFGNVYGTIFERSSGMPLKEACIYLSEQSVRYVPAKSESAVYSNRGWIVVPSDRLSVLSAVSRSDGSYIINNIRISGTGSTYTVIIESEGLAPVIVDSALILPGAVMALQIDVLMENSMQAHIVDSGRTSSIVVTNNFRHELVRLRETAPIASGTEQTVSVNADDALRLRIYATREGLVGGTTANGHVIKERDHFVALPSTRVLCSKGGYEFQVKLEHNGYTETAPVWDIGPWNIHDNYWEPEDQRLIFQYLKDGGQHGGLVQGLPESQAAYENDFNSGRDEFSRRVVNPAGIDLADGTFWDGLNLNNNAWITVKYLWLEEDEDNSETCFIETAAGENGN